MLNVGCWVLGTDETGGGTSSAPPTPKTQHLTLSAKRVPVRTCVACRTAGGKRGLLRVVRLPDDAGVAIDLTGKRSGRGAYVCASLDCVATAQKRKAFERSLKVSMTESVFAGLREAVADTTGANTEQKGATTMS